MADTSGNYIVQNKYTEEVKAYLQMLELYSQIKDSLDFDNIKNDIKIIRDTVNKLSGFDGNATIRDKNGIFKQIVSIDNAIEPSPITNLIVPNNFSKKSNYFFENFITPLLFVSFDLSKYIDKNIRKIFVKRLILNIKSSDEVEFFNTNFKGKNDIKYEDAIQLMVDNGITFFADDEVVNLPLNISRYSGTFDVIELLDVDTINDLNSTTLKRYKLSSLYYTDNLSGFTQTVILKPGDILVKGINSWAVDIVDIDSNVVHLRRLSGNQSIALGVNELSIQPTIFNTQDVHVSIGFDEYQMVFMKTIDDRSNVQSSYLSFGCGFYSNDLIITLENGDRLRLGDFYKKYALDLSEFLLAKAKENNLPNIKGVIPNSPKLFSENFKVVQINEHLDLKKSISDVRDLTQQLNSIEENIKAISSKINEKQLNIQTNVNLTLNEKDAIRSEINSLLQTKSSYYNQYKTSVSTIEDFIVNKNLNNYNPKYRIRGFWEIPSSSKLKDNRLQEIVQFYVEYKYLKNDNTEIDIKQMDYVDSSNKNNTAYFSNWNHFYTKPRKKVFNTTTNNYECKYEDTKNGEIINTNQLDISINYSENVQIRVQAISEAGYPDNPLVSDFSEIVTVSFQ